MEYNDLLNEIAANDIDIIEDVMPGSLEGLYIDNTILVSKSLDQRAKKCVLAEELAHHKLNAGNIIDQHSSNNRREEKKALAMAYESLVTPEGLIQAFEAGCANIYEIAEFLDVTEFFLSEALSYYNAKFGLNCKVGKRYRINFEPLTVKKNY